MRNLVMYPKFNLLSIRVYEKSKYDGTVTFEVDGMKYHGFLTLSCTCKKDGQYYDKKHEHGCNAFLIHNYPQSNLIYLGDVNVEVVSINKVRDVYGEIITDLNKKPYMEIILKTDGIQWESGFVSSD